MPRPRIAMRKIREVLRLALGEGLSRRQVSAASGVPLTTVNDYLRRAAAAGLQWPLPGDTDDTRLEQMLYCRPARPAAAGRPLLDWRRVHTELRRKHVTLQLLWLEYREAHPDGYGYSQFANLYKAWQGTVDVTMRQAHKAGEKLFVDFPGEAFQRMVGFGDLITAALALIALAVLRARLVGAIALAWTVLVVGMADTINAIIQSMRYSVFNHALGVNWVIVTIYVPALLVSSALILWQLLRSPATAPLPTTVAGNH
jgi:hypothetical protein